MSDTLLLTLIWLTPLIGSGVVLLIPKGSERFIKHVATAFMAGTFAATLAVMAVYLGDSKASAPLADRVMNNRLTDNAEGSPVVVDESDGQVDLLFRCLFIKYFNIQY